MDDSSLATERPAAAQRYASLSYAKHRARHAQCPLRARVARAALPARQHGRPARRHGHPRVRDSHAARTDRRRPACAAAEHRRSGRLHLERPADEPCCRAAEGRSASHRRGPGRTGGQSRDRSPADLPARGSHRHRLGRCDLSPACAPAARGAAASGEGPSGRTAAARGPRHALRRVHGRGSAAPACLRGGVAWLPVQVRVLSLGARQDRVAVSARTFPAGTR